VLAAAVIVAAIVLRRKPAASPDAITPQSALRRFGQILGDLTEGVRGIGRSGLMVAVAVLALLKLVAQALSFLSLLWAYNLPLPLVAGLAVFLAGYLGTCIPSTPAGTGMFQLFVVAALTVLGIAKPVAAGFALAAFVAWTVPLAAAGFFAFAHTGLRLHEIQGAAGRSHNH